jgi:hypothetical protein
MSIDRPHDDDHLWDDSEDHAYRLKVSERSSGGSRNRALALAGWQASKALEKRNGG